MNQTMVIRGQEYAISGIDPTGTKFILTSLTGQQVALGMEAALLDVYTKQVMADFDHFMTVQELENKISQPDLYLSGNGVYQRMKELAPMLTLPKEIFAKRIEQFHNFYVQKYPNRVTPIVEVTKPEIVNTEVNVNSISDVNVASDSAVNMVEPSSPTEGMYSDEAPTEVMHPVEEPTEVMHPVEEPTEVMYSDEAPTEVMRPVEEPTEVMHSIEAPTEVMHPVEEPTEVMYSDEAPTEVMRPIEEPTEVMRPIETPTEEMPSNEVQNETLVQEKTNAFIPIQNINVMEVTHDQKNILLFLNGKYDGYEISRDFAYARDPRTGTIYLLSLNEAGQVQMIDINRNVTRELEKTAPLTDTRKIYINGLTAEELNNLINTSSNVAEVEYAKELKNGLKKEFGVDDTMLIEPAKIKHKIRSERMGFISHLTVSFLVGIVGGIALMVVGNAISLLF